MAVDPLTYGVAALRSVVWSGVGVEPGPAELSLATNVAVLAGAAAVLVARLPPGCLARQILGADW